MTQQLWPIRGTTDEQLRQAVLDWIVQAVLERSELVEPAKPLRQQKRDRDRERMVDALFAVAAAEAESR